MKKLVCLLALVLVASLALAQDIPAPFEKARQYALTVPVQQDKDGTTFRRLDLERGDVLICFGMDDTCIWIGSNQFKGAPPLIINYYPAKRCFTIQHPLGEAEIPKEKEAQLLDYAFQIMRKAVELGLL